MHLRKKLSQGERTIFKKVMVNKLVNMNKVFIVIMMIDIQSIKQGGTKMLDNNNT